MTKRLRVPVRPRRLLPTEVMTNARRARTTLSERPMVTARVKAMPPVGNGKTARPVTNAAHMATVKTRAAIRAKVIRAAMITARVMSATIGATTVAPTAATSVAMTAAPWATTTAPAGRMHALAPVLTRVRTRARLSPRVPQRPPPLSRSITTAACACPS